MSKFLYSKQPYTVYMQCSGKESLFWVTLVSMFGGTWHVDAVCSEPSITRLIYSLKNLIFTEELIG